MHWIFIALAAPFIWSLLNHTDKYLISKYSHHIGIGGLAIMSSIFAGFTLPVVYLIDRNILGLEIYSMLALVISGILTALGLLLYLYALDKDDVSHVVPFWFLIPIFSYGLGLFFLDENLETGKMIGAMITLVGSLILSLEFDQGFSIKKITPILMIGSSLCLSLNNVLFKDVAVSFWQSIFWNQVGMLIFAILMLVFVKKYRADFVSVFKINNTQLNILNLAGEILQIVATFVSYYSILIAPVALVLLVSYTFQPLFVFLEGILLTMMFPHIVKEKINRKHLIQKTLAIGIMVLGVYQIML